MQPTRTAPTVAANQTIRTTPCSFLLSVATACALALGQPLAAQSCGTGTTAANQNLGTGWSVTGVMFDITVGLRDMTIECLDIYWVGFEVLDFEVLYCPNTCVGNQGNPGAWTRLGTALGVATQGFFNPTVISIPRNGATFSAGQSYGIYIKPLTWSSGCMMADSGGGTSYQGAHCDITSRLALWNNWSGAFPAEFQGNLHTSLAASVRMVGMSCGTGALLLTGSARPVLGTTIQRITLGIPPGTTWGLTATSLGQAVPPVSLTPYGMEGCVAHFHVAQDTATWWNPPGTVQVPLTIPNSPWLAGATLTSQSFSYNPGTTTLGLVASNGLVMVAGW